MSIERNNGITLKHLILLIFVFLLFSCSNTKKVYWCGDHACINNKEKKAYFKKTMIVEIRELSKQNKKSKSEVEKIKKQAGLELEKEIQNKKQLNKQARLEEKRRNKEEKELAKQVRLEEKKSSKKKVPKTEKAPLEKEVVINTDIAKIEISSTEFKNLVEKITRKNMFRSYPDINDIPN